MKVRATQKGYDGWALREVGTVFEIKDSQFSDVWMEKVAEGEEITGIRSPLIDEPAHPMKTPVLGSTVQPVPSVPSAPQVRQKRRHPLGSR
jgi:hypothetical protein